MASKTPKLPKLWIRFGDAGVHQVYLKRPWYWGGVHRYVPAPAPKKAKARKS